MLNTQSPELVTIETLQLFKEELLKAVGLTPTGLNNIIQTANSVDKISNSAVFGKEHKVNSSTGLQDVLVTGQGNIITASNQTIIGTYNQPSTSLFIVGNGTSNATRKNAFEITSAGEVKLQNCSFTADATNSKFCYKNKIAYAEDLLTELSDNMTKADIEEYLADYDDSDLIAAGIIKKLIRQIPDTAGLSSETVEELIKELDYTCTDAEAKTKALSLFAGKQLQEQLANLDTTFANAQTIISNYNLLKQQISYLISCLTVNKLTNSEYKSEMDPLLEYYTIGIADFALDNDTNFTIENYTGVDDINITSEN